MKEKEEMNELIPFGGLDAIAQSIAPYPVDFDDAWQWVGYSTKGNALRTLQDNFEENLDFLSIKIKSTGGRPGDGYFLTIDCFKAFCMMAGTERGKEVRRYFLEVEKRYKSLVEGRRLSKFVRRDFTDVIQASGLNDAMHGFAYKQFTDLVNKAVLGVNTKKYREINSLPKDADVRERLAPAQLAAIVKVERLVGAAVEAGADYCKVKDMIACVGIGGVESRESGGAA